ncbi:MAG: HEAT repeat domain-containing protein [Deltaproteobacteria bacterium]|nr:MAG: HEAT repeat domain-containing protein [Deltaproteobacteria bacterium]
MASVEERKSDTVKAGPSEEQWQAAEKVLISLQLARKNYSLYPENHVNCTRAQEQFWLHLDKYLRLYGNLRFDLAKDKLLFQGEIILSEPSEEGNLPFTLFRDGIQWLELQRGIDSKEVEQFLRLLNRYRILSDEPEGDLVTALWEARFPHIQYYVADMFWGAEPEFDLTVSPGAAEEDAELLEEAEEKDSKSECFSPIEPAALKMTPEEEAELREMVRVEEKRDPVSEYLDVLLDSLMELREKENFVPILESLEDVFHDSLARKHFEISLKILKSLHYVRKTCATESTWALPLIDNFFLTASSAKSLRPLQTAWLDMDTDEIGQIKQILVLLQPEAIQTLGGMLLETSSLRLQKMLLEVILVLAYRDLKPLEAMLGRPEEELVQKLVYVLGRLDGEKSTQILARMVRHPSARVRHEALKPLLSRGPTDIKGLFHLIEDKNDAIRRLVLRHMAQERNKVTETLLMEYLEQGKLNRSDDEHIIACFRTLGRCGSPRSIPFLRKTLLGRPWLPGFRKLSYRQGAAYALQSMGMEEAQEVLEEASRSLFPTVRGIARKIIEGQTRQRKG